MENIYMLFYKKVGLFKKYCQKIKAWFKKKGNYYVLIIESILIEIPNRTLSLDSYATTHVSHVMHEFISIRPIRATGKICITSRSVMITTWHESFQHARFVFILERQWEWDLMMSLLDSKGGMEGGREREIEFGEEVREKS